MHLTKFCLGLVFLAVVCSGEDRKVEVTWNPGCDQDGCKIPGPSGSWNNLVYAKATGASDVVHFMFSNIGSFTIMVFKTSLDAELSINWSHLLSKNQSLMYQSIQFSKKPTESSGYSFPIVYEFNDYTGQADMTQISDNATYWVEHRTDELIWSKFSTSSSNSIGMFEAMTLHTNGSIKFVIKYPGKDQRDSDLPHLLLTPEASSVEFVLDSLEAAFKKSKFALNVVFLSNYELVKLTSKRTLDDEYTPGTFRQWNVEVSDSANNVIHNFLQWKPIFYYNNPKSLENSTITKQYDIKAGKVPNGIGSVFFDPAHVSVSAMNVSFGLPEDKPGDGYYYPQTNYSAWSFSMGIGAAPNEKMSSIVTLVIFIGFGLPALVIVVGILVMIVRKIKNSRSSQFNEL